MKSGMDLPDAPKVTVPVTVYFFDTDAAGVVHNVAYLRMIEVARTELAARLGWGIREMLSGVDGCPVVARTEIDYLKPAKLGDLLEITSELIGLQRIRFFVLSEIRRAGESAVLCSARQTLVPVDPTSGRPRLLRKDWLERWPHLATG